MAKESAASLGNDRTMLPGLQRSVPKSLGDQSTLGGLDTSAAIPDQDDLEIVDLAKRYQIESLLGQGGMGEVQLATDTRLKRKVAIKRVLGPIAQSKSALSRFLTEAQSIAALSHPNVVQIYDYGRSHDGPFLIMEYVDGGTLLDRCTADAIPLETAVELVCQLCDGLGRAHDAGIIHRDIKPANVLMTRDGTAKLTDFGLAKIESGDNGMTMTGAVLGTVDFMPPEQRRAAALIDARSDLWSMAATLYQMVTGKSPKIIRLDQVPEPLKAFFEKALEDAPDDRFQTAIEFREALRATLTDRDTKSTDLVDGQCSQCHTLNDTGRKYCRSCGSSLEQVCLSCKTKIPIWEQYCGNCGANQVELLQQRLDELAERQVAATTELDSYRYDTAISSAIEIGSQSDPRLKQFKNWSEIFITEVKSQRSQQLDRISGLLDEALTHETLFDYSAAIHALLQVPAALRDICTDRHPDGVAAHLDRIQKKESECKRLEKHISQQNAVKKLAGLLKDVESLHELRPDRADVATLREQLLQRQEKLRIVSKQAIAEAHRYFGLQDYDSCIKEFSKIDADFADKSVMDLLSKVQDRRNRLQQMRRLISQAVAENNFAGLLTQVNEALELKADSPDLLKLQKRLREIQKNLPKTFVNSIGMELVRIPAGNFMMGSRESEAGRKDDETIHRVTLTKDFYLGTTVVTQGEYERVMGTNPSYFSAGSGGRDIITGMDTSRFPVEEVSWDDAVEYCRRLSALPAERAAGRVYRLPTEAEWEYACRAGTMKPFHFGSQLTSQQANFDGNYPYGITTTGRYLERTATVGSYESNGYGLFDMHGNVLEWCSDWYRDYTASAQVDPLGAATGSSRVNRGGGWFNNAEYCRSANRDGFAPDSRINYLGFRVALGSVFERSIAGP